MPPNLPFSSSIVFFSRQPRPGVEAICAACFALLTGTLHAADTAVGEAASPPLSVAAPPNASALASSGLFSGFLQVAAALLLVLVLIFGVLWVLRRMQNLPLGGSNPLKLVGGVMVGQRERVVVVEIEGRWLVLGVTAAEVQLLDRLEKPGAPSPTVPLETVSFAERFSRVLRARLGKEKD